MLVELKDLCQKHGLLFFREFKNTCFISGKYFELSVTFQNKRYTVEIVNCVTIFKNIPLWEVIVLAKKGPYLLFKKDQLKRLTSHQSLQKRKCLYLFCQNCYWCNKPLTLEEATLEHIIPLSRGGDNGMGNLTLAHELCNSQQKNYGQAASLNFYKEDVFR